MDVRILPIAELKWCYLTFVQSNSVFHSALSRWCPCINASADGPLRIPHCLHTPTVLGVMDKDGLEPAPKKACVTTTAQLVP